MSLPQNFQDALPLVQAAANASNNSRHLVSVYFNGGMDNLNTLYPTDNTGYGHLVAMRGDMVQPQNGGVVLNGQGASLHHACSELGAKFNAGKLAIIGNVGNLARPLTRATVLDGSAIKPLVLQSHADQERQYKTARPLSPAGDMGWIGLAMDLIDPTYNAGSRAPATISVNIGSALMNGNNPAQYTIGESESAQIFAYINGQHLAFIRSFAEGTSGNFLLQKEVARRTARGNSLGAFLNQQLATVADIPFPNTALGRTLKMAAKLIVLREALGHRRSVFNIQLGGWDTHNNVIPYHEANLPAVSQALNAFHEATKTMGPGGSSMENDVVLFTGTDFGRCGTANSQGTDHGWGGNNYVLGGPVLGGSIYRKEDCASTVVTKNSHHNIALGGKNDYGQGTLIPTTSSLEYAATLLEWFGIPQGAPMACVLPDLEYFPAATRNLGFLNKETAAPLPGTLLIDDDWTGTSAGRFDNRAPDILAGGQWKDIYTPPETGLDGAGHWVTPLDLPLASIRIPYGYGSYVPVAVRNLAKLVPGNGGAYLMVQLGTSIDTFGDGYTVKFGNASVIAAKGDGAGGETVLHTEPFTGLADGAYHTLDLVTVVDGRTADTYTVGVRVDGIVLFTFPMVNPPHAFSSQILLASNGATVDRTQISDNR